MGWLNRDSYLSRSSSMAGTGWGVVFSNSGEEMGCSDKWTKRCCGTMLTLT